MWLSVKHFVTSSEGPLAHLRWRKRTSILIIYARVYKQPCLLQHFCLIIRKYYRNS